MLKITEINMRILKNYIKIIIKKLKIKCLIKTQNCRILKLNQYKATLLF